MNEDQELEKCVQCGKGFSLSTNGPRACNYHPTRAKITALSHGNYSFSLNCCGAVAETATDLLEKGCVKGYHHSRHHLEYEYSGITTFVEELDSKRTKDFGRICSEEWQPNLRTHVSAHAYSTNYRAIVLTLSDEIMSSYRSISKVAVLSEPEVREIVSKSLLPHASDLSHSPQVSSLPLVASDLGAPSSSGEEESSPREQSNPQPSLSSSAASSSSMIIALSRCTVAIPSSSPIPSAGTHELVLLEHSGTHEQNNKPWYARAGLWLENQAFVGLFLIAKSSSETMEEHVRIPMQWTSDGFVARSDPIVLSSAYDSNRYTSPLSSRLPMPICEGPFLSAVGDVPEVLEKDYYSSENSMTIMRIGDSYRLSQVQKGDFVEQYLTIDLRFLNSAMDQTVIVSELVAQAFCAGSPFAGNSEWLDSTHCRIIQPPPKLVHIPPPPSSHFNRVAPPGPMGGIAPHMQAGRGMPHNRPVPFMQDPIMQYHAQVNQVQAQNRQIMAAYEASKIEFPFPLHPGGEVTAMFEFCWKIPGVAGSNNGRFHGSFSQPPTIRLTAHDMLNRQSTLKFQVKNRPLSLPERDRDANWFSAVDDLEQEVRFVTAVRGYPYVPNTTSCHIELKLGSAYRGSLELAPVGMRLMTMRALADARAKNLFDDVDAELENDGETVRGAVDQQQQEADNENLKPLELEEMVSKQYLKWQIPILTFNADDGICKSKCYMLIDRQRECPFALQVEMVSRTGRVVDFFILDQQKAREREQQVEAWKALHLALDSTPRPGVNPASSSSSSALSTPSSALKLTSSSEASVSSPSTPFTPSPYQRLVRDIPCKIPDRKVALIIGCASYPQGPLRNPVNDAKGLADALKNCGFTVTLLVDPELQAMEAAVKEFVRSINPRTCGIFFFAGHGHEVDGSNYLVPITARTIESVQDVKTNCYSAQKLQESMEARMGMLNIIILDACRSNSLPQASRATRHGLALQTSECETIISFACEPGKVAFDGNGDHGLYSEYLIQRIQEYHEDVRDIFMKVRKDVLGASKKLRRMQKPWESCSTSFFYRIHENGAPSESALAMPSVAVAPSPASASSSSLIQPQMAIQLPSAPLPQISLTPLLGLGGSRAIAERSEDSFAYSSGESSSLALILTDSSGQPISSDNPLKVIPCSDTVIHIKLSDAPKVPLLYCNIEIVGQEETYPSSSSSSSSSSKPSSSAAERTSFAINRFRAKFTQENWSQTQSLTISSPAQAGDKATLLFDVTGRGFLADISIELNLIVARPNTYNRQYAICIGVGSYQDSSIPALQDAADSAKKVSELLTSKFGFAKSCSSPSSKDRNSSSSSSASDVPLLLSDRDATRSACLRTIASVAAEAGPDDLVLIYLCTRSLMFNKPKSRRQNKSEQPLPEQAFFMHDTWSESPLSGLSRNDILITLQQCSTRHIILLIDGSVEHLGADMQSLAASAPAQVVSVSQPESEKSLSVREHLDSQVAELYSSKPSANDVYAISTALVTALTDAEFMNAEAKRSGSFLTFQSVLAYSSKSASELSRTVVSELALESPANISNTDARCLLFPQPSTFKSS